MLLTYDQSFPFPDKRWGKGAGSVETSKALLAAPLNSQSSNEETSGQGSAKKETNQDMQDRAAGPPTSSRLG